MNVLFIPGIMGSELYEGSNKRWFPLYPRDLEFIKDISKSLDAKIIESVGIYDSVRLRKDIYGKLTNHFISDPDFDVYAYDWRQNLFDMIPDLVSKIKLMAGYGIGSSTEDKEEIINQVTLVGHSMGGLLIKLAVLQLKNEKADHIINKIITIGTPWLGTPDAYKVLHYGDFGVYEGNPLKNLIPALNLSPTRELARKFPSAYQLLPQEMYTQMNKGDFLSTFNGTHVSYSDFKNNVQALWDDSNDAKLNVWDQYIKPLHDAMREELPGHIAHDCLIGFSIPTLYAFSEKKPRKFSRGFKKDFTMHNGDGTVSLLGAYPQHKCNKYFVSGLEHGTLCSADRVIEFIEWSLTGKKSDEIKGITTIEPEIELKEGTMAWIKCPVETTILDSKGGYIEGPFDPTIKTVSPLANSIYSYSVGEAKYFYFNTKSEEDIVLTVNAYETGIADIAVEEFNDNSSRMIIYEPIPVTSESTAKLIIPLNRDIQDSELTLNDELIPKRIIERAKDISNEIKVPKLKVQIKQLSAIESKIRRNIYCGEIQLEITSKNEELLQEKFYSINNQVPVKYEEPIILDLSSGSYEIHVYGKDIYNRPTVVEMTKFSIDNEPPRTRPLLKFQPEGFTVSFDVESYLKTNTYYQLLRGENPSDDDIMVMQGDMPTVESMRYEGLNTNPDSSISLEYHSVNEYDIPEEARTLVFGLGHIPTFLWEDLSKVDLLPRYILGNIFELSAVQLEKVEVTFLGKKMRSIQLDERIGDDAYGVRFESEDFIIDVMYAEKYSLYFKGSPTEMLEVGKKYEFSFALLSELNKYSITDTKPRCILKCIAPKRNDLDKIIPLVEGDHEMFFGSFFVDESFEEYKYKLIITDDNYAKPALREVRLTLKEE